MVKQKNGVSHNKCQFFGVNEFCTHATWNLAKAEASLEVMRWCDVSLKSVSSVIHTCAGWRMATQAWFCWLVVCLLCPLKKPREKQNENRCTIVSPQTLSLDQDALPTFLENIGWSALSLQSRFVTSCLRFILVCDIASALPGLLEPSHPDPMLIADLRQNVSVYEIGLWEPSLWWSWSWSW